MAGYSGTPLIKKFGIKEGFRIAYVNAPDDIDGEIGPLPNNVKRISRRANAMDFVLLFTKSQASLRKDFSKYAKTLVPNGMLWIAWPKRSSGVITDINENNVREIGLAAGLVDVKICAITEIWSGLKFVYRVEDRKQIN
jgi:hypothetical protein